MKTSTTRVTEASALCASLLLGTTLPSHAAERELGSHRHGATELDVVIDGDEIFLTFETPWANLVGFEHAPGSPEDVATVEAATARLETGEALFAFPESAGCRATDVTLDSTMADAGEHDEDHDDEHGDEHGEDHDAEHGEDHDAEHGEDHDGEHGDEHAEDHDAEHGDEHAEDHDAEHGEDHDGEHHDAHGDETSSHSEVVASYAFTCDDTDGIDGVDVRLGEIWSGVDSVDVQLAGPSGQHAQRLARDGGAGASWRLDLTPVNAR